MLCSRHTLQPPNTHTHRGGLGLRFEPGTGDLEAGTLTLTRPPHTSSMLRPAWCGEHGEEEDVVWEGDESARPQLVEDAPLLQAAQQGDLTNLPHWDLEDNIMNMFLRNNCSFWNDLSWVQRGMIQGTILKTRLGHNGQLQIIKLESFRSLCCLKRLKLLNFPTLST